MDIGTALTIGLRPIASVLIVSLLVTPIARLLGKLIPEGRIKRVLFRQIWK